MMRHYLRSQHSAINSLDKPIFTTPAELDIFMALLHLCYGTPCEENGAKCMRCNEFRLAHSDWLRSGDGSGMPQLYQPEFKIGGFYKTEFDEGEDQDPPGTFYLLVIIFKFSLIIIFIVSSNESEEENDGEDQHTICNFVYLIFSSLSAHPYKHSCSK